jgi:hypothetical protein
MVMVKMTILTMTMTTFKKFIQFQQQQKIRLCGDGHGQIWIDHSEHGT